MTKGKVIQIGLFISLIGLISYKFAPQEQRKRYRKEYEKVVNDKLETKFNSLSKEEQQKLMEDLEKNP